LSQESKLEIRTFLQTFTADASGTRLGRLEQGQLKRVVTSLFISTHMQTGKGKTESQELTYWTYLKHGECKIIKNKTQTIKEIHFQAATLVGWREGTCGRFDATARSCSLLRSLTVVVYNAVYLWKLRTLVK